MQYRSPVASIAFAICLSEKPISNNGTAMAGGGGEVESRLLGSDKAVKTGEEDNILTDSSFICFAFLWSYASYLLIQ